MSKVVGTFHKFWGWGTETFTEQSMVGRFISLSYKYTKIYIYIYIYLHYS